VVLLPLCCRRFGCDAVEPPGSLWRASESRILFPSTGSVLTSHIQVLNSHASVEFWRFIALERIPAAGRYIDGTIAEVDASAGVV
jgi:hypothetical protein